MHSDREGHNSESGSMRSQSRIYREMKLLELGEYASQSRILQIWQPKSFLDKGTFSRIFCVVNVKTGRSAALKYVPNPMDAYDCREIGSAEDAFYQSRYAVSKREAEIMNRFRGESCVVQYLEEPEYLQRMFVNAEGKNVMQYAVLICMPLYKNSREWLPQIKGNRAKKLQLGIEIAHALELFEERGVYHRDIKPGNIMMDDEGHFRLGDVGEAKLESEQTTVGFHGTRAYMAPEVYNLEKERGRMRSDHRSDIYSLGIVLYRLFNEEQFPFLGKDGTLTREATESYRKYIEKYELDEQGAAMAAENEKAHALRYDGEKLPAPSGADKQLSYVILKACAYRKEERWQTAAELREALECCAAGRPLPEKLRLHQEQTKVPARKEKTENSRAEKEKSEKKSAGKGRLVIMGAVGILCGCLGIYALLTSGDGQGTNGREPALLQLPTPSPATAPATTSAPEPTPSPSIAPATTSAPEPTPSPSIAPAATSSPQVLTEKIPAYYPSGELESITYCEEGARKYAEYYAENGALEKVGTFQYHDDGTSIETIVLQATGETVEIAEYGADERHQYNKFYEDGVLAFESIYSWDVEETLPLLEKAAYSMTTMSMPDENIESIGYYTQEEEELGVVLYDDGEPTCMIVQEWQQDGTRIQRQYNWPEGKIEFESYYDAQDREIAMLAYDEEGDVNYKTESEYFADGYYEVAEYDMDRPNETPIKRLYEVDHFVDDWVRAISYSNGKIWNISYNIALGEGIYATLQYDPVSGAMLNWVRITTKYDAERSYGSNVVRIYDEKGKLDKCDYTIYEDQYSSISVRNGIVEYVYGDMTSDSWIGKPWENCELINAPQKEKKVFEWMKSMTIPDTLDCCIFPSKIDVENLPKVLEVVNGTQSAGNAAAEFSPGEVITFGVYDQDNHMANGKEDIAWRVLDVFDDGCMLLISDYILEQDAFHESFSRTEWAKCTLHEWLNGEFYEEAFTNEEKSRMLTMLDGDHVILLSDDEAEQYASILSDLNGYTESAAFLKDFYDGEYYDAWWLRTSGGQTSRAVCVKIDSGEEQRQIIRQVNVTAGVRPVILIQTK